MEDIATRDMCAVPPFNNGDESMQTAAGRAENKELAARRLRIRGVFSHALFWPVLEVS